MLRSDSSPQELRLESRVGRKAFLGTDVGSKYVLMSVESGTYISLDPVGKGIWERLEEPQTVGSLCEQLQTAYLVADRTRFERDVIEFIANLRLQGLVEIIP